MNKERLLEPKQKPAEIDELRRVHLHDVDSAGRDDNETEDRDAATVKGSDIPIPSSRPEFDERLGK